MFKHILFATDGSELSERAAAGTVALAKALSARVTAITVSKPFHTVAVDPMMVTHTSETYRAHREKLAMEYLGVAQRAAEIAGVPFDGVHTFHDQPYVAILDAATERGCDAICMASHGRRGVIAMVLGSETVKVLTHAKIPVVVWR